MNIILSGYKGRMGNVIINSLSDQKDINIVAGVDKNADDNASFKTYKNFSDVKTQADVIIDFSNPSGLSDLLFYAMSNKIACVICTTGLSESQIQELKNASSIIPVFFSANMSLGVNLLIELSKTAAKVLGNKYDIEIVEAHHNQKLDAPSGTAVMIANEIASAMEPEPHFEFDRHSKRAKRGQNEIGIHSVRGGTIVGEHEVMYCGPDEIIKISHSAGSREIFATGAIKAAMFINGKQPALYSMTDLING